MLDRPSDSIRVLSLLLIALLAWPWNVALSIAESSQAATRVSQGMLDAHGATPRLQRPERNGPGKQPGGPLFAADFDLDQDRDEEGGDVAASQSASSGISSIPIVLSPALRVSSLTSQVPSPKTCLRERLCRFRC